MRNRHLGWILTGALLGAMPAVAHADALSDGRKAIQKGDLRTAQINLRNAVRSDPQNAEAHYWLGKVSLDLGDPVAAEREAREARQRGFDPHQAVPLLAQALLAQNKFQDMLNDLQADTKDNVLDAEILVARGYAQIGLKNLDAAQKSFEQAEQAAPNAVEPLLASARFQASRGDLDGALAKIDKALAAQPKSAPVLLAKAELLRAKGDQNGSLALLNQVLADQPGDPKALLDRAGVLIALNQPDKAKADLDLVLKALPNNIQATYLQAVIQVQNKDFKGADATLDRISAYIPNIPRAYYLQAIIKEQLGQLEQAEEAARRYLARAPNDLTAYKVLARIDFAKRRPDLAIDVLSKVVDTGHGDAETYDLIGRAYAAAGRADDALKAFQKAETMAPNDVGVQTRLASVRMGMGQADAAMGDLEHTLQLAPTQPQVGEALFFAALATGDLKKASDAIDKVRAAEGDTPVVGNLDGLLKLSQLDLDGATAKFNEVLQKHPDFLPAKINLARIAAMQGRTDDADLVLTGILDKAPTSEPALSMLVTEYTQNGHMPEAIALINKARAAQPDNVRLTVTLGDLLLRSGKPADALDMVNKEKTLPNSVELLNLKAAVQVALGQKDQARDTYSQLLKIDPTVLSARRQLETLLIEAGDYERARNTIKEGLALTPRNYQLYQDYVMVDLKANGVNAAVATAGELQQQDRDFQDARALKGDVYVAANRPADAVAAYQEALTAAPSSMLVTRLSSALLRSGQPDSAAKVLSDWATKHPDDLQVVQQLSDLDLAAHHYDEAAKRLEFILSKQPHNPVALNNLAWIYQQQSDPRAEALAHQAYLLSPGGQTADTLGWILTTSGKADSGLLLLRQAASQSGEDPRIQYHYAVALKDTGSRDQAIKLLNTVVENKANFVEKADAQKLLTDLTKGS